MPSEMLVEIDIEAAIPKDEYKAALAGLTEDVTIKVFATPT